MLWLADLVGESSVFVNPLLGFAAANIAVGVNQLAYSVRQVRSPGVPEDEP